MILRVPLSLALALLGACSPPSSPALPSIVLASAEPAAASSPPPPLPAKPCVAPPPVAMPPQAPPDRARLAAGLDAFHAGMVQSDRSDLTVRPAPYLSRGKVWDLEHFGHAHPFYMHLGEVDGGPTVNLASPAAFVEFARNAGLTLDDDTRRAAYVKTYLSLDPRVLQLLEAPGDLRFIVPRSLAEVKLSPEDLEMMKPMLVEEIQRRRQVEERHVAALVPLCLRGRGPFHGVIHAILRQQILARMEVALERSGAIAVREVVIAEKVPVTMVYP